MPDEIKFAGAVEFAFRVRAKLRKFEYPHIACGGEVDNDCPGFSWRPCGLCGTTLGGNRHRLGGLVDGETEYLDVCEDCTAYVANGTLPEEWRLS